MPPGWPSCPGKDRHDVAVVLGSGFAPAAAALGPADAEIPLADLGGFPPPTVAGHVAMVRSLTIGGLRVLVYLGRVHLYESHPPQAVAHGVRTAIAAGAAVVVLTNAAGGINADYRVGQPVLISDHLNLTGRSPLSGPPPPDGYPPRFADLTEVYSARLRALARAATPAWPRASMPHCPAPTTRRRPRSGCSVRSAPTWWGCPRRSRRSRPATSAPRYWRSHWSPTLPPGLAGHGLDHEEVIAAGAEAAGRIGALLASILPEVTPP